MAQDQAKPNALIEKYKARGYVVRYHFRDEYVLMLHRDTRRYVRLYEGGGVQAMPEGWAIDAKENGE